MRKHERGAPVLVIAADDYGYWGSYDEGILTAVRAQAVDAVSVMVLRSPDAGALQAACAVVEADIGLHLDRLPAVSVAAQVAEFERLFGAPPAYLDGHHHCHAEPATAPAVARVAAELGASVRAVDASHRELVRRHGAAAADRLVGRLAESDPVIPPEIDAFLAGTPPPAVTEWMVHPGRAGGPSSYDSGRASDLEELLRLGDRRAWRRLGVLRAPPSRAGLR